MKARSLLLSVALTACAPRAVVRQGAGGAVAIVWKGAADEVRLCGTMTSWRCVPLVRREGRFEATLSVSPGRHEYRLEVRVGAEVRIVLPEGVERADDGYGGENAVLRAGGL